MLRYFENLGRGVVSRESCAFSTRDERPARPQPRSVEGRGPARAALPGAQCAAPPVAPPSVLAKTEPGGRLMTDFRSSNELEATVHRLAARTRLSLANCRRLRAPDRALSAHGARRSQLARSTGRKSTACFKEGTPRVGVRFAHPSQPCACVVRTRVLLRFGGLGAEIILSNV